MRSFVGEGLKTEGYGESVWLCSWRMWATKAACSMVCKEGRRSRGVGLRNTWWGENRAVSILGETRRLELREWPGIEASICAPRSGLPFRRKGRYKQGRT